MSEFDWEFDNKYFVNFSNEGDFSSSKDQNITSVTLEAELPIRYDYYIVTSENLWNIFVLNLSAVFQTNVIIIMIS